MNKKRIAPTNEQQRDHKADYNRHIQKYIAQLE